MKEHALGDYKDVDYNIATVEVHGWPVIFDIGFEIEDVIFLTSQSVVLHLRNAGRTVRRLYSLICIKETMIDLPSISLRE